MLLETSPSAGGLQRPQPSLVQVLFFGRIADVCGRSLSIEVPTEGCALAALKARIDALVDGRGAAISDACIRVAVDQVIAHDQVWVSPGQEVAFLAPFSGG